MSPSPPRRSYDTLRDAMIRAMITAAIDIFAALAGLRAAMPLLSPPCRFTRAAAAYAGVRFLLRHMRGDGACFIRAAATPVRHADDTPHIRIITRTCRLLMPAAAPLLMLMFATSRHLRHVTLLLTLPPPLMPRADFGSPLTLFTPPPCHAIATPCYDATPSYACLPPIILMLRMLLTLRRRRLLIRHA